MRSVENKILVTGAAGLIGSSICRLLYQKKIRFVAVVREHRLTPRNWEIFETDIESMGLGSVPGDFDTVFHCAARIPNPSTSFQLCSDSNIAIDKEVAQFIATRKIRRLVFASTTNLYRLSSGVIDELSPLQITNEYAVAKLQSEKLFLGMPALSAFCLRLNAPYGPHQTHETVLSSFLKKSLRGDDIFYHGSGERHQDFTHADDVAEAFIKCLSPNAVPGTYNISAGHPISMKSLAELILSLVPGSKSRVIASNLPDPQEDFRARFDQTQAERYLRWRANISLRMGLSDWISTLSK